MVSLVWKVMSVKPRPPPAPGFDPLQYQKLRGKYKSLGTPKVSGRQLISMPSIEETSQLTQLSISPLRTNLPFATCGGGSAWVTVIKSMRS